MAPLRVVILTCSDLGFESAAALMEEPAVCVVGVLRAPSPRPRTLYRRVRRAFQQRGAWDVAKAVVRKLWSRPVQRQGPPAGVDCIDVDDFHSEAGLQALRDLKPDLAVIDGTGILRESVFKLPVKGSLNIHCAYLPDYRGAPPVYWELFNGESSTGVTIHRVVADLDAGPIIARRRIPLPEVPRGADPLQFSREVWRTNQRPVAMELLKEAVVAQAVGTVVEIPQAAGQGRLYRAPSRKEVDEFKRRLAAR